MAGGADLHLHTTASDGTLSPAEMVALSREQGLAAVAITDHDTAAGLPEALAAGERLGIQVIPGVELSCPVGDGHAEVHLLGYLCRFDDGPLADLLTRLRRGRLDRAAASVERLRARGYAIDLDRVLALGGESVGRAHIAQALVEAGYAQSVKEAFDRFLVPGRPGYVPRPRLTLAEAIQAVREAGGVPILAHPGLVRDDQWVAAAIDAGVMGLEAYHTEHSAAQAEKYARWAEARGLLVTGGSDSHGPRGPRPVLPGHVRVGLEVVERLLAAAGRPG
ncbi:MAG: PHP domain-containing protein [Bacillota bacterium]